MITKREKFLIFVTALTVSYIIMNNQETANNIYDTICCKVRKMKEKLAPM